MRIRSVPSNTTWYDYKMAVVGTLMDNKLYLQPHEDLILIYKCAPFTKDNLVFNEKRKAWKDVYDELPEVLKTLLK